MRDLLTPPPADDAAEQALADALEEHRRRSSSGERPDPEEFRALLGATHARFQRALEAELELARAMDGAADPVDAFPRPFGPYTLLGELGQGGMGVVYEAFDPRLDRRVAVKVLHARFRDDSDAYRRFEREAKRCAGVRHDHIVAIHDRGLVDGQAWYAMDLVAGAPLSRLVAERRVPDAPALARGLAGVADALEALHAAGVLHRDVKPQNLLVRPDGRMILADFGLARHADDDTLTRTGGVVGTPAYMAPEQILGQTGRLSAATDVYGLGATLYECLVGHVPFRSPEYGELVQRIRTEPPAWPEAPETVHAGLRTIATKALYKEPIDRYASAAALADDLRRVAGGAAPTGRLLSPVVRARRLVARRWRPFAAAAALLAVLGTLWSRREATLALDPVVPEDAVVWIDGVERGRPPLALSLKPGRHTVSLRRPGFRAEERVLEVGAGDRHTATLRPLRPNGKGEGEAPDRATLAAYAAALARVYGVPLPEQAWPPALTGTRGPRTGGGVTILAPRGRVRRADLGAWWVELDPEGFVAGGRFELRRGTQVLWRSEPYEPRQLDDVVGRIALDGAALAALEPGARLRFAHVPASTGGAGAPVDPVELEVVADDLGAEQRARLEEGLGGQEPALAAGLRAAAYRGAGLPTAALREVSAALRADGGDALALSTLRWLLREEGLEKTDLVREVLEPARAEGSPVRLPGGGLP